MKEQGIVPRDHGNKGRLPHNAFSFDTTKAVVDYIINYATYFGLPQPAARRGRAQKAPVYLPASEGYDKVNSKYLESCVASGKTTVKYHSFRLIWLQCVPHIKFMTPRTDVCNTCETYRMQITHATREVDKLSLSQQFKDHVVKAQVERQYYLDCMQRAEKSISSEVSPSHCHYTIDFAQQLQIPYHARQVGPIYFKSPLKVQLFGICNDGKRNRSITYSVNQSLLGPMVPRLMVLML